MFLFLCDDCLAWMDIRYIPDLVQEVPVVRGISMMELGRSTARGPPANSLSSSFLDIQKPSGRRRGLSGSLLAPLWSRVRSSWARMLDHLIVTFMSLVHLQFSVSVFVHKPVLNTLLTNCPSTWQPLMSMPTFQHCYNPRLFRVLSTEL